MTILTLDPLLPFLTEYEIALRVILTLAFRVLVPRLGRAVGRVRKNRAVTMTPAEAAGRIAGDAVNAGTLTPEAAGDAWQMWADKGGPAGEEFAFGYITTGAAPWW